MFSRFAASSAPPSSATDLSSAARLCPCSVASAVIRATAAFAAESFRLVSPSSPFASSTPSLSAAVAFPSSRTSASRA